jgi:hypothetical protein
MPIPSLTTTNSAATSTLISAVAGSGYSRRVTVVNTDAAALCIRIGATATTSAYNARIIQNALWESPGEIQGSIFGIWEADGTGAALVTEY